MRAPEAVCHRGDAPEVIVPRRRRAEQSIDHFLELARRLILICLRPAIGIGDRPKPALRPVREGPRLVGRQIRRVNARDEIVLRAAAAGEGVAIRRGVSERVRRRREACSARHIARPGMQARACARRFSPRAWSYSSRRRCSACSADSDLISTNFATNSSSKGGTATSSQPSLQHSGRSTRSVLLRSREKFRIRTLRQSREVTWRSGDAGCEMQFSSTPTSPSGTRPSASSARLTGPTSRSQFRRSDGRRRAIQTGPKKRRSHAGMSRCASQ